MIPLSDIRYIDPVMKVIKGLWKSKKVVTITALYLVRIGLSLVELSVYLCPPCSKKRKRYVNLSFVDNYISLAFSPTWRAKLFNKHSKVDELYAKL